MKAKLTVITLFIILISNLSLAQPVAVKDSFVVYGNETIVYIDPRINDYDTSGNPLVICDVRDTLNHVPIGFSASSIPVNWFWESFLQYRVCSANDPTSISEWTDLYINRQASELSPHARFDEVTISPGDSLWARLTANDLSPTGNKIVLGLIRNQLGSFKVEQDSVLVNISFDQVGFLSKDTLIFHYAVYDSAYAPSRPKDYGVLRVILTNNHWHDQLDVNNLSARFNCYGNQFWDLRGRPMFYYPKGSSKTVFFVHGLWVGGLEINGNDTIIHTSAEKNAGIEFSQYSFGPISSDYTLKNDQRWFRTWKLDIEDIDYHKNHWWLPGYKMHENIATWPGNGNIELGQAEILAPFEDLNDNGLYEPQIGEFPRIRGDQSVFFIFNDENVERYCQECLYLGIEVHGMAYGFKGNDNPVLNNTVFLHYDIINRSEIDYHDTHIGNFTDADIGYCWDDYIGSNVQGSYFYQFNGSPIDGSGQVYAYGEKPPAAGSKILRGPLMDPDGIDNPDNQCDESVNGLFFGDDIIDNERFGMTSFQQISGSLGVNGIPDSSSDYYNYLRARWRDNSHLLFGGIGHFSDNSATEYEARFMFPDPESDSCNWNTNGIYLGEWTEISTNNPSDDRRGVSAAGPFTFYAGSTQSIDLAFFVAPGQDSIPQTIDTLQHYSAMLTALIETNESLFALTSDTSEVEDPYILIYPNPAQDLFYIDMHTQKSNVDYKLYDISGRMVQSGRLKALSTNELYLKGYPTGLYFLSVNIDGKHQTHRLMKVERD